MVGRVADICAKADSTTGQAGGESFDRQSVCRGEITCGNSTFISNSHLQLVISDITGIILVILGTVNVQFQGAPVPISLQSILIPVAAQVQVVWSSCS